MPLTERRQEDFSVGVQEDVAPHLIDARGLYSCTNGLFNDDGSDYKRGGSQNVSKEAFGETLRSVWDGWMEPGRRTLVASEANFGVLAADGETIIDLGGSGFPTLPKTAALVEGLLFIGGGTIYGGSRKEADYSTGTITATNNSATVKGSGTSWTANVDAGMLLRVGTERVYVVKEVNSNTELTLKTVYEGTTGSGKAYSLKRLQEASSPYLISDIYLTAAQRLIVVTNENKLRLSEPNKPHSYETKIEPGGAVVKEEHELEDGVKILGGATLGIDRILAFTTKGIVVVSNLAQTIVDALGAPQHRLDWISHDVVLWGNAGVASWRDGLVIPAQDGVYLLDGVSAPQPLSHGIEETYHDHVASGHTPGLAWVFNDHYFLPVLNTSGTWQNLLICRLDRPATSRGRVYYPWSFADGAGAEVAAGVQQRAGKAGETRRMLCAAADGKLIDCSSFFKPEATVKKDHDGSVPRYELVLRDFALGDAGAIRRFRKLRVRYSLEAAEGDEPHLYVDEGLGIRLVGPQYNQGLEYNKGVEYASTENVQWTALTEPEAGAPPNAGLASVRSQNAVVWYGKRRARFLRFRLRSADPVAKLTIRAVEVFAAPGGGVRISKVA